MHGHSFFFILRILHEGHTPAAEAASTEGQQQDTANTLEAPTLKITQLQYSKAEVKVIKGARQQRHSRHHPIPTYTEGQTEI
jgi:hypothetical protein